MADAIDKKWRKNKELEKRMREDPDYMKKIFEEKFHLSDITKMEEKMKKAQAKRDAEQAKRDRLAAAKKAWIKKHGSLQDKKKKKGHDWKVERAGETDADRAARKKKNMSYFDSWRNKQKTGKRRMAEVSAEELKKRMAKVNDMVKAAGYGSFAEMADAIDKKWRENKELEKRMREDPDYMKKIFEEKFHLSDITKMEEKMKKAQAKRDAEQAKRDRLAAAKKAW